jgi:tetratricopeptide (TPR) repeat protein
MRFTTTALVLVLGATAAPAFAQYMPPPPPPPPRETAIQPQGKDDQQPQAKLTGSIQPSGKARKALIDLQKAVDANDVANIPAKLAAAQAVASTKEDRYLIGQMQLKSALKTNDSNAMRTAIDAIAASGYQSSAEVAKLYMALGGNLYNAKQYQPAAAALERAAQLDPSNTEVLTNLGETRFAEGRAADAVAVFQRAIQAKLAAGQKPEEALYKRALSIAYNNKLPNSIEISREWVAAYPTTESWHNAVAILRNQSQQDEEGTLDLLRLLQAAGALNTAGDYGLFAEAAADQSNFNEAQAVLDAGIAAHIVNPADPKFRDDIAGLKGKPKASAADLEAALKTSPSAINVLRIGDRFYGMGNYSRAAEVYRQAISKGVDPNVGNLHLGMALARSGDKAGATAAFKAVTGARAEIAKFWLVYVQQHG